MIGFAFMCIGVVTAIIGSLGLLRFPDVYTRTHAQTVCNVGGACMILLGVFLQDFLSIISIKSLLLVVFIFLTAPVGAHAITRAAHKSGIKPKRLVENEMRYKLK